MKIAFGVNCLHFLRSHRFAIVQEARKRGWETHILAGPRTDQRDHTAAAEFTDLGCVIHEIEMSRSGRHLRELWRTVRSITNVYRGIRPDLVHHISPKMVLLGSVSARRTGVPAVVNAISGLGFMFTDTGAGSRLRGLGGLALYAFALRHENQVIIVQNERDLRALQGLHVPATTRFVRFFGSGVDLQRFRTTEFPSGAPIVILPARMLTDKGILVFCEAASILKSNGIQVRMVLCGPLDIENPGGVSLTDMEALTASGAVEWWGQRANMPEVLAQATIVALPSHYAEGLPLALAEAAAAGRPIITTDLPGCRDTVIQGESGLLIPPRDAPALADAITVIVRDRSRALQMGAAGRKLAESRFGLTEVVRGHFEQYAWLRDKSRPQTPFRES
jgi:glycosyltransferase involved in cell wall biosynthesis